MSLSKSLSMDSSTDWQISKTSLSERFRELYKLNEWTDCTFSVGDDNVELIRCHKIVLAASSPVFEALFFGPLATYDSIVHVPDLEPDTFNLLLGYFYCDAVEFNCILDAGKLLYASKKYLIPHLSRKCVDYIIQHIRITNLWEALDVAESLNEEELLETCLKVMRQYSIHTWLSSNDHLSKMVLCRLLDEDRSNISETELWTFVLSWAEKECRIKGIEPTPQNIRAVIDDGGLLKKIRFLTFTKKDFYELVEPSCIISSDELAALKKCIDSISNSRCDKCCDNSCDKCVNNNNNSIIKNDNGCDNLIVPEGFNNNCNKRIGILGFINHCSRKILTKRKLWIYGGVVCTKITSQMPVLIKGFEVFTRIPNEEDYCLHRDHTGHYNERIVIKICDDKGVKLGETFYSGKAEFNTSQNIKLSKPIWFHPCRKYTVTFELPAGQYPLCELANTLSSKIAFFQFEEIKYSDFSFICAVMFSV